MGRGFLWRMPQRGLVFRAPFREGTGTTARDLAGNNHGTITGADWAKDGGVWTLDFEATDATDVVVVTNFAAINFERTDSYTLAARVKAESFPSGARFVLGKRGSAGEGYGFYALSSGKIETFLQTATGASNWIIIDSTTVLSTGTWYTLIVTYDGSEVASGMKLYINAVSDTVTTVADTLDAVTTQNTGNLRIGDGFAANQEWDGLISEVAIWNRELSAADVAIAHRAMGVQ